MDWITVENVIIIASQLMNIGEEAIKKAYQFERDAWVFNLRETLNEYLQCSQSTMQLLNASPTLETLSSPHEEVRQYYLSSLLEYTKAFVELLTAEAKEMLKGIALGEQAEESILH